MLPAPTAPNARLQTLSFSTRHPVGPRQAGLASIPRNASAGAFSSLLDYNGPIPLPTLDEYILVHRLVRGVFLRNSDIWNIYKARA